MMDDDDRNEKIIYQVVVNDEGQYSIWAADRKLPFGWRRANKTGYKRECLDYIGQVWTDMTPRSLRRKSASKQVG